MHDADAYRPDGGAEEPRLKGAPDRAAEAIRAAAPGFVPRLAVMLGSGLGDVADRVKDAVMLPYDAIPGFPTPRAAGHAGRLVLGRLEGLPVACLQGRVHAYEDAGRDAILTPVRAMRLLGAEILLLTNAAGSLRPNLIPGRLMNVSDHINLMGWNPLVGPNDDAFGPRFPSMRDAYDPALREALGLAASRRFVPLSDGILLACAGPNFETAAEVRAFRALGADAVGMSVVPEAIAARHCGLRVCALSAIVNFAEGIGSEAIDHDRVLDAAKRTADDLGDVVAAFAGRLWTESAR